MKKILLTVIAFIMTSSPCWAATVGHAQPIEGQSSRGWLIAQNSPHDQICYGNYNQCMHNCQGATYCVRACNENLQGCLAAGR